MIFKRIINTTLKIVINLGVLVSALLICVGVAEIGVRVAEVNIPQVQGYTIKLDNSWGDLSRDLNVINPIPPSLGQKGFLPHPYIGITQTGYRDRIVGSLGNLISHAPDVCNIGVLGGSGALYYAEYEHKVGHLSDYLSKKYQHSRCKTFAIVNLGIGGSYAPSQLYMFLQNLDVLDLVIVIDGFNELFQGVTSRFLWPVDWPPHHYYQDFVYLQIRKNLESGIQIQLFKELHRIALKSSRSLETGLEGRFSVDFPKLYRNLGTPGIDDSQTTIPLNTTEGFPLKGTVTIDSESIAYTGISGNSLTGATRGANNTAAIAHGAASRVTSDAAIFQTDQGNEFGYWLGHSKLLRYLSALVASYTNQRVVDLQRKKLEESNDKDLEDEDPDDSTFQNYVNRYAHLEEAWQAISNDSNSVQAQYWRPKMGWDKGNQSIADFGRAHAEEDNEVLLGQYIADISPEVFAVLVGTGIDNSQTTIPLNTTEGFPSKGTVTLGQEQISYTGISGNSLTGATRGANNTAAIAHGAGSRVTSDTAAWTDLEDVISALANPPWSHTRFYKLRQEIWLRTALLLQKNSELFNIPIVHALQPVLLPGVKTLTPLETSYGFDQNVRQSYSDYDSYIKELQLLGVRIHDFRNIFINFSGDAFIDTVHLTEAGNKIMSDRLIEVMEASLPATLQADDRAPSKIDWNLLYR